jgi:hypothetical protein
MTALRVVVALALPSFLWLCVEVRGVMRHWDL